MYPPVKIPLTGLNRIERGASWGPLEIFFPGDFAVWNPLGQIRTKAGGKLLATFGFEPIILADRVENGQIVGVYSRIAPFLTSVQTLAVLATMPTNLWEYDIVLQNPDDLTQVFAVSEGPVEVSDRVTVIV
ncbi:MULTISPECIES: hypothetical protein [Microcystis]|uniref:hypothetical protein n=1 Tax=Microcystis TaxID=1125 RepID=UPI001680241F|nr:hypothetical protein [Microcystis wesenbergii]MBD2115789.1 hypothetical protein [Microcystis wesenbergii FACHB-1339]